ncbi:MAG: hypothetical protein WD398_11250 [Cyclobacteriaceae bacterium]
MNKCYLILFASLVLSCQLDSDPRVEIAPDQLEIASASSEHKVLFEEWIGEGSSPNARTTRGHYSSGGLVEIRRGGVTRWAVPKLEDPSTSLSFVLDSEYRIANAFVSNTMVNPDRTVTSRIFSLDNQLMGTIVHNADGTLRDVIAANGFRDWFRETDYCLEKVTEPFDSTFANIVMDATFAAATLGLYIPAVILSCSGFGLARM